MSHTVVRGKPNAAQLYLDGILDAILLQRGVTPDPIQRDNVTLSQILYHCLKERPHSEFMTNGATGEKLTNGQLLKRAVSLARALTAQGAKGKYAFLLMRNHQDMTIVYYAVMFTGMIPFISDPLSLRRDPEELGGGITTVSTLTCPQTVVHLQYCVPIGVEMTHFLKLVEPSFIFLDQEFKESVEESLQRYENFKPTVIVTDEPGALKEFSHGYSDDVESFQVAEASMDDPVMFLPTSGSTGTSKAAIMTHRGLVAQLPTCWSYFTQFPTPTDKVMVLSPMQWMTFTMMMTSCPVYHVPVLISPKMITPEHVTEMLETYRPTWTFMTPAFAGTLLGSIRTDQLSSVETLILLGSPSTPELMTAVTEKLPKTAHLCNGYGTTETQGFIAIPDKEAPLNCNGWVINILHYKIVDDQGQQLGPNESGELYLKGTSVIKGYHKNLTSNDETFTPDGWFKTGDVFHVDENERLTFIVKKKFSFKYMGWQVSPEEVERVIGSVPGVSESVVCSSDNGPTAAVVLDPEVDVSREQIHKAVDSSLSDYKRLRGGIAFVPSLPHTYSGKLKRTECSKLISELIKSGHCY